MSREPDTSRRQSNPMFSSDRFRANTVDVGARRSSDMNLDPSAVSSKYSALGEVDKTKKETVKVHFISSCNAENEEDVMCEPYNLFIPDIHLAIDLETTTNALIPRIIRQIGMPDVTGDLFSLYVYWEGKKPRPLGPEELVLPSLVWVDPDEKVKALSKRHAEAKHQAFNNKPNSTSIKKKIRSMSFGFKSQSSMPEEKKISTMRSTVSGGDGDPRVGYEMFSGGDNFGFGDESFDDMGDGGGGSGSGDYDEQMDVDCSLSVKLVFKIRLFIQHIFHRIDCCGVQNPVSKYQSNFRSLLLFQIENYIATQKWPMEIPKIASSLPAIIGLSMSAKFGKCDSTKYDKEAVYAHTIAVYGDVYFKSTNDVMRLTGSTLEDYWREASKDFESQGKEELGNIRNPYELCFHNMVSKVYGASYGVENFTVEMGLDGGESNLQEVQLGVNETGLLVFDVDSGALKSCYLFEYISKWGHIPGKYFYFFDCPGKGQEGKETRIYTSSASQISSLLREYAVALMNIGVGRYNEVGLTKTKIKTKKNWKRAEKLIGAASKLKKLGALKLGEVAEEEKKEKEVKGGDLGGSRRKSVSFNDEEEKEKEKEKERKESEEAQKRKLKREQDSEKRRARKEREELEASAVAVQAWTRSWMVRVGFEREAAALTIQAAGRRIAAKGKIREALRQSQAEEEQMQKNLEWKRRLASENRVTESEKRLRLSTEQRLLSERLMAAEIERADREREEERRRRIAAETQLEEERLRRLSLTLQRQEADAERRRQDEATAIILLEKQRIMADMEKKMALEKSLLEEEERIKREKAIKRQIRLSRTTSMPPPGGSTGGSTGGSPVEIKAAVKVQAAVRGYALRNNILKMERDIAATTVQEFWRRR
mmetsp:Transcript_21336/g.40096  ORF Transcript_21336/g.40096 Transcript_21336/m.40096 type:complete len:880 (-) Transcript_21336:46-2685(-)